MRKISIKIKIGNREYTIKACVDQEKKIIEAGKILNEKINNYQYKFEINDKQDLLAMVAFDCLVENLDKKDTFRTENNTIINEIQHLNYLIEE